MNQKFIFFIIGMLLALPLISAMTLTTDKSVYSLGETITISGNCNSPSTPIAFQLQIGDPANTVWIEETNADSTKQFSITHKAQNKGTNSLYAACQGESSTKVTFCVGTDAECGTAPVPPAPPAPGGGSSSGGGDGSYCNPKIQCEDYWSYCNATLKQSRLCVDLNNCKLSYKEEKNCTLCEVSWVCSLWSECQNGKQLRTCVDSHYCQTNYLKPSLEKSCAQAAAPGPAPAQVTKQIPPPAVTGITEELSFWDKYKWFITLIPAALVLIGAIVFLILHFKKPQAYNLDELKNWIQQEKQAGTPDANIRQILAQQTGWRDEEISQAFRGLAA